MESIDVCGNVSFSFGGKAISSDILGITICGAYIVVSYDKDGNIVSIEHKLR